MQPVEPRGRRGLPRGGRRSARRRRVAVDVPTAVAAGRRAPGMPSRTSRSSSASRRSSVASSSLRPPGAKSLMPLSAKGLCDAEIIAAGTPSAARGRRRPGSARRRGRPTATPSAREAGGAARPRAAGPRRGCRGRRASVAAETRAAAAAEGQAELGRQLGVGDPADPVGAEPQRTRGRRSARLSAWSTAAPSGPSSGRTSWTPSRGRRG